MCKHNDCSDGYVDVFSLPTGSEVVILTAHDELCAVIVTDQRLKRLSLTCVSGNAGHVTLKLLDCTIAGPSRATKRERQRGHLALQREVHFKDRRLGWHQIGSVESVEVNGKSVL